MKHDEEVIEPEIVKTEDIKALAVINASEIDQQVATAKKFPRSVKAFLSEARDLVTLSEEVAADCIFALPRGKTADGKKNFIEGPSVRFAEIIAHSWGNARCGSRPMGEEDKFVTAQGYFFDMEKNVATVTEVRRSIFGNYGRYKEDMIGVTVNAACSIARRNAALQGIPKAIWQTLYDEAKATAIGNAETLIARRTKTLQYFQKMKVTEEMLLACLDVKGIEDIGLDELTILRGIATAIKEGSTTVDKAFAKDEKATAKERSETVQPQKETPKAADHSQGEEITVAEEIGILLTDLCAGDQPTMDMMLFELSKGDKVQIKSMTDLNAMTAKGQKEMLARLKAKMNIKE
jgi:hypothetical protein